MGEPAEEEGLRMSSENRLAGTDPRSIWCNG